MLTRADPGATEFPTNGARLILPVEALRNKVLHIQLRMHALDALIWRH